MASKANKPELTAFKGGDDWWLNACVGYHSDPAWAYIDGYKEAADRLVNSLASDERGLDTLVYPIAYLYRHYVELSLKQICSKGSTLLGRKIGGSPHHDLKKHWAATREVISAVWSEGDADILARAEKLILEFDQVDPGSTTFRYARERDGTATVTPFRHVNVRVLYEAMDELALLLDGANAGICHNLDNMYG